MFPLQNKITLDRKIFEALASETRVSILKSLDERPKTIAELSRELSFSKSSLHEHLSKMLEVGLVEKQEYSKWVYYKLTDKGKSILHPHERLKILVLLSFSFLSLIGSIFEYLRVGEIDHLAYKAPRTTALGKEEAFEVAKTAKTYSYAKPFALLIVSIILLYLAYRIWKKSRDYKCWRPKIEQST